MLVLRASGGDGGEEEATTAAPSFLTSVKRWLSPGAEPAEDDRRRREEEEEEVKIYVVHKRDVASTIEKRRRKTCCPLGAPVCSDDQLMVYLAEIQAINPESIINLATFDNLHLLCKQVSESLDKMDQFLKTCRIPPEKDLYIQLIKGVDRLYDAVCETDSKLRKDFKAHFACLKELHEDFETCFGPPDWTEESSRREICRAYKDIAECYYIKAAKVCGKEAAKVMKRVVKAVVDSIITVQCNFIVNPKVEDAYGVSGAPTSAVIGFSLRCCSATSSLLPPLLLLACRW